MSCRVTDHALATVDRYRERLAAFTALPSVGGDPAQARAMEDTRSFLEGLIAEAGFTNQRRLGPADSGHQALYAERLEHPGAPTLLVYGHYDVQPPEPYDLWHSPPFEMTERDGRLYARGISDDKGPLLIALHALAAFEAVDGTLPLNVKLLIEGEEETGSPSMPAILNENADLLSADAMLSADGGRWRADLLTLNVGSRGSGGFEITLRTAAKDLHSGRYGGAVPNALHEMARLLAGLHDDAGRITCPGFTDGLPEPDADERAEMANIPFDEGAFADALGTVPQGEDGYTTLERLWLRPTVELNGMWGGHTGAGGKTVTPAEAHAKITLRFPPGQDAARAQDAVIADLRARTPAGATLDVFDVRQATDAASVPQGHPLLIACGDALEAVHGHRPRHVRMGASLPLVNMIKDVLGIETVMFSFSTSDEDFHAPNEFLRAASIPEGIAAWVAVLRRAGALDVDAFTPYRG
ncbi:M20/M25/M40 family metallo-hydrolase [Sulfitobacter albidus]|uniref:M20/M25/M40 family metallo-hydrolase n=1 Tax=Sulfitobacter albidus TaxID=2829501 RepID=A0A975JEV5_9RHOB|nr:M20/M25/M40 family metallo-hydrolase [Sulfitobacter albidus]QUJ77219.1 M20/M25/M40 family metallo-hydrolase [Sulfitobacter albidus]